MELEKKYKKLQCGDISPIFCTLPKNRLYEKPRHEKCFSLFCFCLPGGWTHDKLLAYLV